jgi:hypothetical protein
MREFRNDANGILWGNLFWIMWGLQEGILIKMRPLSRLKLGIVIN